MDDLHVEIFIIEKVNSCIGGVYLGKDWQWHEWDEHHPIGDDAMTSDEAIAFYSDQVEDS